MKKTYKLRDLDCANCAAKMENAIGKLPEVSSVTVSFMTQKMTVEYADGVEEAEAMKQIRTSIIMAKPLRIGSKATMAASAP